MKKTKVNYRGRILDNYEIDEYGNILSLYTNKYLTASINKGGYLQRVMI